jgi:hypothetical protein
MGDTNDGEYLGAYQDEEGQQLSPPSSPRRLTSSADSDNIYIMHNDGAAWPEVQVLKDCTARFLTSLAAGCRERLPDSTTSTTMVANPIDIFWALNQGFLPVC